MTALRDVQKIGFTYQIYCPIKVCVDPDPLGDVNCVIRVLRRLDDSLIKAVLHRNTPGIEKPKIGYGSSHFEDDGGIWGCIWGFPVWYVEVDGERVIEVPEHETWPPTPPPPPITWRRRPRTAVNARTRKLTNRIAGRFGYVREDDIEPDW